MSARLDKFITDNDLSGKNITMSLLNLNGKDSLKCMEVRGGHGGAANFFKRPGLDVWIWSESQRDTHSMSGDLHYITSCASGRITRMIMSEVGGTANVFTDVAERMRDLMKRNINRIAQTTAVRQMSASLTTASDQGGFASTLLCTYFAPLRSFTICNAGHPPPLLYRSTTDQWHILKSHIQSDQNQDENPSGNVLPQEYQSLKLTLELGDMVLSYSNALTECHLNNGQTLGVEGLRKLARRLNQTCDSEYALEELVSLIRSEHQDNLKNDEATVMLSKVTHSRVSMRDNILAPFRLARRSVSDRTSL